MVQAAAAKKRKTLFFQDKRESNRRKRQLSKKAGTAAKGLLYLPKVTLLDFAEKVEIFSESVAHEEMTLRGLAKYQNYSIQVVAATKIGEGLKSRSIYCRTKEDGMIKFRSALD